MTPAEVTQVLAYFTAAWPWIEVGDDTPLVWAEHLGGTDAQDAHTAARKCVQDLDRPPSVAEFLRHVRAVSAGRRPQLAAPTRTEVPKPVSRLIARALAAGMREAATTIPEHRFHTRGGGQDCPACSTSHSRDHGPKVMASILDALADGVAPDQENA